MAYTNKLHVIYGDGTLGVGGNGFHYIFSYERGGLESLKIDGKEWLYRVPTPTYWRATTDNDRGSGFNVKSAQWLSADAITNCTDIKVAIDGKELDQLPIAPLNNKYSNNETAELVKVTFIYTTLTVPATTSEVSYEVRPDGSAKVTMTFHGKKDLPDLPVFGLRMIMPTLADGFDYTGLSGETYPDRMAGGIKGTYHIDGLPVDKYLVPQEMGMHMANSSLTIQRSTTQNNADPDLHPFNLQIAQDDKAFNFSLLPYTAEELENATHIEELPPARRTVLVVAAAVRGVGGIDSWGSDVEDQYHIKADHDIVGSFILNAR